jgi:hypothetical protein
VITQSIETGWTLSQHTKYGGQNQPRNGAVDSSRSSSSCSSVAELCYLAYSLHHLLEPKLGPDTDTDDRELSTVLSTAGIVSNPGYCSYHYRDLVRRLELVYGNLTVHREWWVFIAAADKARCSRCDAADLAYIIAECLSLFH